MLNVLLYALAGFVIVAYVLACYWILLQDEKEKRKDVENDNIFKS